MSTIFKAAFMIASGAACLIASNVRAQPAGSEVIAVHLSNFAFTPEILHLHAGRTVTLHIVNDSSGGHDLSAPELFAASTFPTGASPAGGRVEIGSRQSRDLVFVPKVPGRYHMECTHFLHSLFGMRGSIVVEAPAI
jgi:plastocyanin